MPDSANFKLEVRVLVDTYASVQPETLATAQKRVSSIFQQVGVEILWGRRLTFGREFQSNSSSRYNLEQIDYIVRILPRARPALRGSTLGEALPCQLGEAVCFASVFYDRVKQRTDPERISFGQVLGHAMAHELGHLLLGSNSHSPRGIMHAKWSTDDMKRAARGDLWFTPEQATAIRNRVLTLTRVPSASFPEIQKNLIER